MPKYVKKPADYILPLNINGLEGRMMRIPTKSSKKREILLVPGHHTSHERVFGLADYLSKYGNVTVPDLPGFGGMEPFYKIGEKPSLDNLADYMASFIKLRYKNRRLSIIAVSFALPIMTRMFQKFPELSKKVDLLVSMAGFLNMNDFRWKRRSIFLMREGSRIFSHRLPAAFAKHVGLRAPFIRGAYRVGEGMLWQKKFTDADTQERKRRMDFEINLWQHNDIRTYMDTALTMFTFSLAGRGHVDLPLYHIGVEDDHFFNNLLVEEHAREIYKDFIFVKTKLPTHAPTILATAKDVEPFVPPAIRRLLAKKPGRN